MGEYTNKSKTIPNLDNEMIASGIPHCGNIWTYPNLLNRFFAFLLIGRNHHFLRAEIVYTNQHVYYWNFDRNYPSPEGQKTAGHNPRIAWRLVDIRIHRTDHISMMLVLPVCCGNHNRVCTQGGIYNHLKINKIKSLLHFVGIIEISIWSVARRNS